MAGSTMEVRYAVKIKPLLATLGAAEQPQEDFAGGYRSPLPP